MKLEIQDIPVRMIDLRLRAQQLLLPCLVGKISPYLIAILFRLHNWYEMYPRPSFLTHKLTGSPQRKGISNARGKGATMIHNILFMPNTYTILVPAIDHHQAHAKDIVTGPKASDRQVSFVLHRLVAAQRRHVLWHL